jgi:putative ABC transport system permease protein
MKFKDLVYVIMQNFRNRKSRVAFTILGVAVAIAVVLSLVSFGHGLQKNLLEAITTEEALLTLDVFSSDESVVALDNGVLNRINELDGVDRISPRAVYIGQTFYNGVISESNINVIDTDYLRLDGRSPTVGRFFKDDDSRKIIVGTTIAELFNIEVDEIIGEKLTFTVFIDEKDEESESVNTKTVSFEEEYEIIGVVESSASVGEIYLKTSDFNGVEIKHYQSAKVKTIDDEVIEAVRGELINQGLLVSSLSDTVEQANKIFSAIQLSLGIFGTFALLVAAIGLINTMTISLLERTNEIGIMRAIGASPNDIRKIFLVESILIGFMGGVSGILIGFLSSEALNWLFNILAVSLGGAAVRLFAYPIWFIAFIIVISTLVGFIGGFWPARRAANMNPLDALRYK